MPRPRTIATVTKNKIMYTELDYVIEMTESIAG